MEQRRRVRLINKDKQTSFLLKSSLQPENGVLKDLRSLFRPEDILRTSPRDVCRPERAVRTGRHLVCLLDKASPVALTPFAVRKMNILKIVKRFSIRQKYLLKTRGASVTRPMNP